MNSVITMLEIALDTMETNEPINRKEGNEEQANLEAKNAAEIRRALRILRAIEGANEHFAQLEEDKRADSAERLASV